ncbi:hypothetical protein [Lactiplantibacillus plantarum]|uniref:hypothetical protein n=1 Tax=Lactiplantibacillus plantarum TaxID=1590 RepID=UPI003F52C6C4
MKNNKHVIEMTIIWLLEVLIVPITFECIFVVTTKCIFKICYTWPEKILQYFIWFTFYQTFILAYFKLKDSEQLESLYSLLNTYEHCLIYLSNEECDSAVKELQTMQSNWNDAASLINPYAKRMLDTTVKENIKCIPSPQTSQKFIFNIKMDKLECENLIKRKQLMFSQSFMVRILKFEKSER